MLLLHQPLSSSLEPTLSAYPALEKLLEYGHVRAISICNFMPRHMERFLAKFGVVCR